MTREESNFKLRKLRFITTKENLKVIQLISLLLSLKCDTFNQETIYLKKKVKG